MKLLDQYFKLQEEIYDYFGYKEDWCVFPISDSTEYFWALTERQVYFADTKEELESQSGNYYSNEIYNQRFLPKAVYLGKDYTMILVDTHTDGNKFLQIFDNSLRQGFPDYED